MINHKHEFIFIHIPKCAGTSIASKLECEWDGHKTIKEYSKKYTDKYFKFSFCRNPWDRFLSIYFYRTKLNIHNMRDIKIPFTDWADKIYNKDPLYHTVKPTLEIKKGAHPRRLMNQFDWMANEKGQINMDFVGRTENIEKDFRRICCRVELSKKTVPKLNQTRHKPYKFYYDEHTKNIVKKMFERDIDFFKYTF